MTEHDRRCLEIFGKGCEAALRLANDAAQSGDFQRSEYFALSADQHAASAWAVIERFA